MTEPPLMAVEILSPKQSMEAIVVLRAGQKPTIYASGEVTDPATGITVTVEEIFG